MAAQTGRAFLLKLGAVSGSPVTIAAMRSTSFTINGQAVDVTSKDSAGLRTLLAAAGSRSLQIQASGLLDAGSQFTTLLGYAKAASLNTFSLFFDNADTIEG